MIDPVAILSYTMASAMSERGILSYSNDTIFTILSYVCTLYICTTGKLIYIP